MSQKALKYIVSTAAVLLCGTMVFGLPSGAGEPGLRQSDIAIADSAHTGSGDSAIRISRAANDLRDTQFLPDTTLMTDTIDNVVLLSPDIEGDSSARLLADTIALDTIGADSAKGKTKNFLEDVISGTTQDSIVYDVKNKMFYSYQKGDVIYQDMNLKADYMEVDMSTKNIYAFGVTDSLGNKTRPEFIQKGEPYTMDTIRYNIESQKAKVKNVATQHGEGFLIAREIKMMPDKTFHMAGGKYTTCDHVDCPHFYIHITKGKLIPNKKMIFGPAYLVMEDVPIPFLGIPEGFFPMSSGRSSGFLMPSFGEEVRKGFFVRDGGYYFAFNDYVDVTLTGGIYTLGSWETAVASRYIKRYTYSGNLSFRYSNDIIGEKGDVDYQSMNNYQLQWTHTQDPKFRPNSTFSASVNFSSSNYSKYGTNSVNEYLNTQTNSSIAYSKSWAGKPFSFSTNMQHSQNSQDTTVTLNFPNAVFNVSRIYPFKSKKYVGKDKWYHKISMSYNGTLTNNVKVHERDLFTETMYKNMRNNVSHNIPISMSWNILNYINFTPSANYTEKWLFQRHDREWDNTLNQVVTDTTYGFYRVFNYNFSANMTTKIYGMFRFKGKNPMINAIRHVITPTIGFSYTPDFSKPKYGYYKSYQSDASGTITKYSPYEGAPGAGESASINFQLQQNLEMKVRSERDTTGTRKISIIDNLSFNGSYNLLADSMNLSTISASFRTTIYRNQGIQLSATLDPYQVDEKGRRYNRFMIKDGKLARLTSLSTSFSHQFNSSNSGKTAINNPMNNMITPSPEMNDYMSNNNLDANTRRQLMTSQYYDFSIPWNLGFSYSFTYSNSGIKKSIQQSMNFNASVTLTEKWGLSTSGGYDFEMKKLTPGTVNITRDLHCWQMSLAWVPTGFMKQWSFNISVKAASLQDLKYDRRSSRYDSLYD